MIEEQQRHQYLDALGISSWLPRDVLPGAAPSADWIWDFSYPAPDIPFVEKGTPGTPAAEANAALKVDPAAARASLTRSFGDAPKPEVKAALWKKDAPVEPQKPAAKPLLEPTADDASHSDTADQKNSKPQPRFKLALARYGRVLVVDSLPPQSLQDFSKQHDALAAAIVRSVGGAQVALQEKASLLPWPAFASPTLPQGYDDALQTVQHKLDLLLEKGGVEAVLLLGESAAQMVLDRDEDLSLLSGILFSLRADTKVLATHSLTEAMQVPGIKADMWQQLQPLVKHLKDA
ncbi:hypothetical protein QKW35_01225 [Pontibacterium granulatum]|uniref:hypothetical protein n=1 Tax=Pontibacterium granulatum TaxID=2036029 RepID=UPI00249CCC6E|nr:hypothetical protein [Pontibacterium granulatum]MDI3322983.1 hypothetical protein [Pontibacterium granulatum]